MKKTKALSIELLAIVIKTELLLKVDLKTKTCNCCYRTILACADAGHLSYSNWIEGGIDFVRN